jgi:hypothetical protein
MTRYPGGVGSDALVPDATTGRVSVSLLQAHVNTLESAGVLKPRPKIEVGKEFETNMDALIANDAALYAKLQAEYCYYEQRYRYSLRNFLTKATSRNPADNTAAQTMLQNTKLLNLRLNSVLEVMNYIAQSRVDVVNMNKEDINTRNADINQKMDRLRSTYTMLSKENVVINTQKEAVRYTEEKNNYTSNQIALWAAMNVVALGVIFYVYRH